MEKRCETCDLYLLDEYAFQGHMKGKKHLKNVQQMERKKGEAARSVFVTWGACHFSPEDLLIYLAKFGTLQRYKFGPNFNYGIIQFQDSKPVDILLNAKSLQLHGTRLEVKPRTVYQNNSVPKNNNKAHVEGMKKQESETSFEHLKPIFEQGNGFDDQLSSFLNAIALSQTEIETLYESVCVNLNRLFQQSFPKCKTNRFGSTVTELGFKNCDLDIYVDIAKKIRTVVEKRLVNKLKLSFWYL